VYQLCTKKERGFQGRRRAVLCAVRKIPTTTSSLARVGFGELSREGIFGKDGKTKADFYGSFSGGIAATNGRPVSSKKRLAIDQSAICAFLYESGNALLAPTVRIYWQQ
jgi:hypothetical protein